MGTVATPIMPGQADETPRRNRRRGPGRINTRFSMVSTPEYLDWLFDFAAHLGKPEVSDVVRESIRKAAQESGFRLPPPR
jgi:hypothetical protein